MSIRQLAKGLGLSPTRVVQLISKGMPSSSLAEARSWRTTYIGLPTTAKSNVIALHEAAGESGGDGDLDETLRRLRHVERTIVLALEEQLRAGKVAESAALRRELTAVIKSLYDAEIKMIRIAETRGRLISIDKALSMISEALAAPIILLRQLPSLARDASEKARLEVFLSAVLQSMREGAEMGLKNGASVMQEGKL